MMLTSSSTGSSPGCPWHSGEASGTTPAGAPLSLPIEWLVDTGAEICALQHKLGAQFSYSTLALKATGTTGGPAISVVRGIDVRFTVEDATGNSRLVQTSGRVAVKSNDAGSNLLGMEQIKSVSAEVRWDPTSGTGSLRV